MSPAHMFYGTEAVLSNAGAQQFTLSLTDRPKSDRHQRLVFEQAESYAMPVRLDNSNLTIAT